MSEDGTDEGVVYSEMESVQNTSSEILSRKVAHLLYGESGYISEILKPWVLHQTHLISVATLRIFVN